MVKCPVKLRKKVDRFIKECGRHVREYPYLIVMLMHDFSRNLYPSDPYIPFTKSVHRLDAVSELLDVYVNILKNWQALGSYSVDFFKQLYPEKEDIKVETGKVYGSLWNSYAGDMVREAMGIIKERFSRNRISLELIKGRKVLDMGCGSGRYTCALARLGAKRVTGIDYGDSGLEKAKELAKSNRIKNVTFVKGSILRMPFKDEEFDFVFNNGVFQHSESIKKAMKELYRVLKKGGASWFYIYGDGGLFWYARKKINGFMKKSVSQSYAMNILRMIGMPMNRFIFCDNWFVIKEEHTSDRKLKELFRKTGFSKYRRASNGRITDPDYLVVYGSLKDRQMWGDGELRYLIRK